MFEKVNPMHPDKIADRIAGALVDMAYRKEDNPKKLSDRLSSELDRRDRAFKNYGR